MARHQRTRHDHASAGDGLANLMRAQNTGDEYLFGPSILVKSARNSRRDQPQRLFAEGNLVRLLDRRKAGGRANHPGRRAAGKAAAYVRGWFNLAARPDDGVDHRKAGRPDRVGWASIPEQMEILLSTRMRTTTTITRRASMPSSPCTGMMQRTAVEHRRARRQLSWDARQTHLPRRAGGSKLWCRNPDEHNRGKGRKLQRRKNERSALI